jgi:hypothetical protein
VSSYFILKLAMLIRIGAAMSFFRHLKIILGLLLLLTASNAAWSFSTSTSRRPQRSTFTGTTLSVAPSGGSRHQHHDRRGGLVMYDHRGDPPSSDKRHKQPPLNAWNVLATTEKWISATLEQANARGSSSTSGGNVSNAQNP